MKAALDDASDAIYFAKLTIDRIRLIVISTNNTSWISIVTNIVQIEGVAFRYKPFFCFEHCSQDLKYSTFEVIKTEKKVFWCDESAFYKYEIPDKL